MDQFKRSLVGLLAALIVVAPFALTPACAQTPCNRVRGAWETIAKPHFPSGPQTISAFAVNPQFVSRLYVTNGDVVMASVDAGCSWTKSYELPASASPLEGTFAAETATITEIGIPERGSNTILLTIAETTPAGDRPHVVRSLDAGSTWTVADAGLPPLGSPALLRISPSDENVVYLGLAIGGQIELLEASSDGGTTWTSKPPFSQTLGAAALDLEIDPTTPATIWVGASNGLHRSMDSGGSYISVPEFADHATGPVDVYNDGKFSRVMAFDRVDVQGRVTNNYGQTWAVQETPGLPNSIADGNDAASALMTAEGRVWVYLPNVFNWADVNAPTRGITGLISARSTFAFYGFTPDTIEIFRGARGIDIDLPDGPTEVIDIDLVDPGSSPEQPQAGLAPAEVKLRIPAGESKRVKFRLDVARAVTPLDVYFLVDTSSSTKGFLVALAEALGGITQGLYDEKLDVEFGLAEYRNYPDTEIPREPEPNFIYQRRVAIGGTDDQIAEALDVSPEVGGHYNAELAALYHSASGEPEDLFPVGVQNTYDVPPNQQAGFRREAIKIAILATDEPFTEPGEERQSDLTPPDLRTVEEVAAVLNDGKIKQIGLAIGNDHAAELDLIEMADATDSVAENGSVDCDDDGSPDIADGDPLVCHFTKDAIDNRGAESLVPAIVNLVKSVRTATSVDLDVMGRQDMVRSVTPAEYEGVALQNPKPLEFEVTFHCGLDLAGRSFAFDLKTNGVPGADGSTATVACGEVEEEKLTPADAVLTLVPLLAPPPPPPVHQISSQSQAQAQSQAQMQTQASMAAQEEEQPQLAFVHSYHRFKEQFVQDTYQMSAYRSDPTPGPAFVLALGAVMFSVASSALLRTRRRSHSALAYARRRR